MGHIFGYAPTVQILHIKQMYFLYSDFGEFERIVEKEKVVAVYFKVLSNHLFGVTEGNHKNPQGHLCHSQDSNHIMLPYTSQNHYH